MYACINIIITLLHCINIVALYGITYKIHKLLGTFNGNLIMNQMLMKL